LPSQAQTLDQQIQDILEQNNTPGCAAGAIVNGQLVYEGYFGTANFDTDTPVTEQTAFMLASVSKVYTQTAALIAIDQGHIENLSDPINNYLPFEVKHPTDDTDITLAMLINHTSGINDNWDEMPYLATDDYCSPLEVYLENYLTPNGNIYNANLNFNNNVGVNDYCNIGYALIGLVVQSASGVDFSDFVKQNIFQPLCMESTSFFLEDLDESLVAMPYAFNGVDYTPYGHYSYNDYPSGRMRTTLREIANFGISVLQSGNMDNQHILSQAISAQQIENHGGGDQGVSTTFNMDKDAGTGIIILCNGSGSVQPIFNLLENEMNEFLSTTPDLLACHDEPTSAQSITQNISFYPNPAKTHINFSTDYEVERISISSIEGKVVLKTKITNNTIDISSLQNGIYNITIQADRAKNATYRIVKMD